MSTSNLKHDLTGRVFGKITILDRDYTNSKRVAWNYECECGNKRSALSHNLLSGSTTHCGCSPKGPRAHFLKTGQRHSKHVGARSGKLVATEYIVDEKKRQLLKCLCDCGNTPTVLYSNFTTGKQKSCGCFALEAITKHGMSKSRDYRYWAQLIARCTNPKNQFYEKYGGSGITLDPTWRASFSEYYKDVGPRPEGKFVLGRIDKKGNYTKENCRWISIQEAISYREKKTLIKIGDEDYSVHQAAKKLGLTHQAIYLRLKSGREGEDLVTTTRLKSRGKFVFRGERMPMYKLAKLVGKSAASLSRKIRDYGLTPEEALTFKARNIYEVDGEKFSLKGIEERFGVKNITLKNGLDKGLSAQDVVNRAREKNPLIRYQGEQMTAWAFARIIGASPKLVARELRKGHTPEDINQYIERLPRKERAEKIDRGLLLKSRHRHLRDVLKRSEKRHAL